MFSQSHCEQSLAAPQDKARRNQRQFEFVDRIGNNKATARKSARSFVTQQHYRALKFHIRQNAATNSVKEPQTDNQMHPVPQSSKIVHLPPGSNLSAADADSQSPEVLGL